MKKIGLALLLLANYTSFSQAQKKLCVAFYNQENLFDTINNPEKNDEEFLPNGKYLWNTERYNNKLNNMARVIAGMNDNNAPDFLGMCEVESIEALIDLTKNQQLKKFNYKTVFFEGLDERGIDNAFIYKSSLVKSAKGRSVPISSEGIGGDKTRNILVAEITLQNNEKIHFIVNHWPSRREGEKESEYKRVFVAGEVRKICDELLKNNPKSNIIVLGDFNDEPNNNSIIAHLGAIGAESKVNGEILYNTMYDLFMDEKGSHKYRNKWGMLDQIMVSANLLNPKSKINLVKQSAQVYQQDFMLETEEKYKGNPFRTFAGNKYLNGYSDHLPVLIFLNYKK